MSLNIVQIGNLVYVNGVAMKYSDISDDLKKEFNLQQPVENQDDPLQVK